MVVEDGTVARSAPNADGCYFLAGDAVARLPLDDAAALVGVAAAIGAQRERFGSSGQMAERVAQLGRFESRMRSAMTADAPAVRLDVDDNERQILTFLRTQFRARADLRSRIQHTCRTCGTATLTNPEFAALRRRNDAIRAVAKGVGIALASTVSPVIMISSLLAFVKLDPDFRCPHCQGTDADEAVVVFCPECRAQRNEAVLRKCRRCGHDFLGQVAAERLWRPRDEVRLPADPGERLTEVRLAAPPMSMAFHPDGVRLIIGTEAGTVQMWRVGDAAEPRHPEAPTWSVQIPGTDFGARASVALSPDGAIIAVASGKSATVRLLRTLGGVGYGKTGAGFWGSPVTEVVFGRDQDSVLLAAGDAELWRTTGGKVRAFSLGTWSTAAHVGYAPDGSAVAAADGSTVHVWRAADGIRRHQLSVGGAVQKLAFSPDGTALAVAAGDSAAVYGLDDGRRRLDLAHGARVDSVAVNPDGTLLATACADHTARVFVVRDGRELSRITRPGPVRLVAWAPDGRLAVADGDRYVQVWSVPAA